MPNTPDEDAADIALLALGAHAGKNSSTIDYVLLPSRRHLSFKEVVAELRAQKKPVDCRGHLEDTRLVIECKRLEGESREAFRSRAGRRILTWERTITRICGEPIENAILELRADQDELTASFKALQMWLNDYYTPHSLAYVGHRTTPRHGGCIVLEFSHPDSTTIEIDTQE